jgi:hypothetical protein
MEDLFKYRARIAGMPRCEVQNEGLSAFAKADRARARKQDDTAQPTSEVIEADPGDPEAPKVEVVYENNAVSRIVITWADGSRQLELDCQYE